MYLFPRRREYNREQGRDGPYPQGALPLYLMLTVMKGANDDLGPGSKGIFL